MMPLHPRMLPPTATFTSRRCATVKQPMKHWSGPRAGGRTLRPGLDLLGEHHADVLRGGLPDSLGLLIVRVVVESERRLFRWEADDGVHRPARPFHDKGLAIRRQNHAAVFRQ